MPAAVHVGSLEPAQPRYPAHLAPSPGADLQPLELAGPPTWPDPGTGREADLPWGSHPGVGGLEAVGVACEGWRRSGPVDLWMGHTAAGSVSAHQSGLFVGWGACLLLQGQDEGNRVERGKRGEKDRGIWGARKNSKEGENEELEIQYIVYCLPEMPKF